MLPIDIKERILGFINHIDYKIIKRNELADIFLENKSDIEEFNSILDELAANGELFINKKGKVGTLDLFSMKKGKYSSTKNGYGFVDVDGEDEGIFINEEDRNGAFDGDEIIVKVIKNSTPEKKAEAVIVKIIKRANHDVVGVFHQNTSFGFVIVDNKKFDMDIFIPKKYFSGAKNNDKVVCRIDIWPENGKKPEGRIIEVIGKKGDRYVEIDSIIKHHSLLEEFPKKVIDQLEDIPDYIGEEEINGRLDLRNEIIYTIDGADSKDFDDAVCVEIMENGNFKLGVHIADVTHYVTENSPLDREALKRATSVYLVDKVIPMLPPKLSNGICSLNPNVDRLTLSCIMEINPQNGKVINYDIVESVINSKARLTYTEVSDILENENKELSEKYEFLLENLKNAEKLALVLRNRRLKRGAIDFDFPESYIILDEEGIPIDISPYERRTSNKIIEEFMLLTNETISEHYHWMKIPFVYRVHEEPEEDKIIELKEYLNMLGYKMIFSRTGVRPKDLQKALNSIKDLDTKQSVGRVMLRTLRQARYSPESLGHFGLAAKYYSHFTSPIRRYPDLQIHRIIKEIINKKYNKKRFKHYEHLLAEVCNQSSIQERKAELAERDVDDYYKAVYMENKIGEKYLGHISSVTSFGIFVELPNGVEGLIRLQNIPEYFEYVEKSKTLVGKQSGKIYRLGQKLQVKVENVNVDLREIDFSLV
ncbi:ribonuclease R [Peptostreptococcus canis]|uniref:Ribonuclease R n=1 Tax=Peptostreptococcus canis TaxID=1159213 RepID=A0ABR6TJP3_9FIRM|nr:ribonuclease R [Peptostreptococcus canis]MBC2575453.1 ribonuclease R [Peptostreptococcus canis]MBP1997355.1 ribonuclease R [Peptostreptococcus canis]